jgi:hypothetical protein
MPYSKEIVGRLHIANHEPLTSGAEGRYDVVIAEVKSKKGNQPNNVWKLDQESAPEKFIPIEYVLGFIGLHQEQDISAIARRLGVSHSFEDARCRIRYIVFAKETNPYFKERGTTYITFGQIIEFLATIRGECWINSGIGVTSVHNQWEPLINAAFAIFNGDEATHERERKILCLLDAFGLQSSPKVAPATN